MRFSKLETRLRRLRLALINRDQRKKVEKIAREVKYIELITQPAFASEYAKAMNFPHFKINMHFPSLAEPYDSIPKRPTAI